MAGIQVVDVPLHAAGLQHEILGKSGDTIILQRVDIRTTAVVNRVTPGWRTARREQGSLRLVSNLGNGPIRYRCGDVSIEYVFSIGNSQLTISLYALLETWLL